MEISCYVSSLAERLSRLSLPQIFGAAALTLTLGAFPANAAGITFAGTSGTLGANVLFELNGTALTLTLQNTGTNAINSRADVLTALFFDYSPSTILTYNSAIVQQGQQLVAFEKKNDPVITTLTSNLDITNINGSWRYVGSVPGPTESGLGTVGLGIFDGDFTRGTNYGLIGSGILNGNGGLENDGGSPVIRNTAVFSFTVQSGFNLSDIRNVKFQYGTSLSEPSFGGVATNPDPTAVPEPTPALAAMVLGLILGGVVFFKRRFATEA
ncbi:MAG: hypothetical protein H7Y37_12950 [Anaerolineae bacterium]|nr:hypothetical protein [Gloeobacterales cyanobacterium ES-bin-313]